MIFLICKLKPTSTNKGNKFAKCYEMFYNIAYLLKETVFESNRNLNINN